MSWADSPSGTEHGLLESSMHSQSGALMQSGAELGLGDEDSALMQSADGMPTLPEHSPFGSESVSPPFRAGRTYQGAGSKPSTGGARVGGEGGSSGAVGIGMGVRSSPGSNLGGRSVSYGSPDGSGGMIGGSGREHGGGGSHPMHMHHAGFRSAEVGPSPDMQLKRSASESIGPGHHRVSGHDPASRGRGPIGAHGSWSDMRRSTGHLVLSPDLKPRGGAGTGRGRGEGGEANRSRNQWETSRPSRRGDSKGTRSHSRGVVPTGGLRFRTAAEDEDLPPVLSVAACVALALSAALRPDGMGLRPGVARRSGRPGVETAQGHGELSDSELGWEIAKGQGVALRKARTAGVGLLVSGSIEESGGWGSGVHGANKVIEEEKERDKERDKESSHASGHG